MSRQQIIGLLWLALAAVVALSIYFAPQPLSSWFAQIPADMQDRVRERAYAYDLAATSIGLAASIYAAWGVSRIKARLISKIRLPEIVDTLTELASALVNGDAIDKALAIQAISRFLVTISDINRHAPKSITDLPAYSDLVRNAERLKLELVKNANWPTVLLDLPACSQCYGDAQIIIHALESSQKDRNLEA